MSRHPPDWTLIRARTRTVNNTPGGGLHRGELAEKLRMPAHGPLMHQALMIAYRRKLIDFCRQYVVKPVSRP